VAINPAGDRSNGETFNQREQKAVISETFRAMWSPRILSILRIVAGLLFLEHGLAKHFGFPAPPSFPVVGILLVAGGIEIVAGALIAIGLFTRIVAFIASGEMAFAYFMAHFPKNFFPIINGGEGAILFCFIFLFIALEGGGPWSIDAMWSRK
jgi:putative oxidoreductase